MDGIPLNRISAETIFSSMEIKKTRNSIQNFQEKDDKSLKKVCSEMESLFIFQLFKEMRASIPESGIVNKGKGEEIYTLMLDSNMAKEIASGPGIGLAPILYNQLKNINDGNTEK